MRIFVILSKQFVRRTSSSPPICGKATPWRSWYVQWWWLSVCLNVNWFFFISFRRLSYKIGPPGRPQLRSSGRLIVQESRLDEFRGEDVTIHSTISLVNGQATLPLKRTLINQDQNSFITSHRHSESTQQTFVNSALAFPFCLMYMYIGDGWGGVNRWYGRYIIDIFVPDKFWFPATKAVLLLNICTRK